jgi:hypothetical protein
MRGKRSLEKPFLLMACFPISCSNFFASRIEAATQNSIEDVRTKNILQKEDSGRQEGRRLCCKNEGVMIMLCQGWFATEEFFCYPGNSILIF